MGRCEDQGGRHGGACEGRERVVEERLNLELWFWSWLE